MPVKEQVRELTRSQIKLPRQYQVFMYNDDFTPMNLVVDILMKVFDKRRTEAVELMMRVHHGSYAVVGVYPRDIAQTKADEAVAWAREEGYPLKVEAVCQP